MRTVALLMQDPHAGKAQVTDKARWGRQDFMSLLLVVLSCSGFYMGWSTRRAFRRETASIAAHSLQS